MVVALRYRRVSGLGQEDNSSLEKQLERMDEYCGVNGYESAPEYLFTEVMTGVETWRERPELQKMLTVAEQLGKETEVVVVVDHPDRFARGMDLILLVEMLSYYGVHCEFVQTKFADTDEGKLFLHLESYSSKKEWQRIKKRTHDGVVDRVVKSHKPLGQTPCYGYKWDDPAPKQKNCYVFHDDVIHVDIYGVEWTEHKVVIYIYDKAKAGWTLGTIAKSLNDLGVPTRQRYGNNTWHVSRISEMLSNPKYMGVFYAFNRRYTKHGNGYRHSIKPVSERVLMPEGTCPAIVDQETWEAVQIQLDYNKANSSRNAKDPEMALCRHKVARCGYCGAAMNCHGDNRPGYRPRYFCPNHANNRGCKESNTIITKTVDDAVWKRCCEIIRDPKQLTQSIEALKSPNPVEKQEKPIAVQKKELEEEISEYVDTLHTAKTDAAKKRARFWIAHLEEQLQEIETQEKILLGIKENWKKADEEIKKFERWCISMREQLETATFSQKRTCVEYLGIRVKVFKYGSRPRLITTATPPNIYEALSGMKKNDLLTSDSQSCTSIT